MLAEHESEPTIGNNATKTWQRLFRLQLSGTSLPLKDRLQVLKRRLMEATESNASLFAGAMDEILDFMGTRLLGPPLIGGRVPPPDWYPKTWDEMRASIAEGLTLLDDATQHPIVEIAENARKSLINDIERLSRSGWINVLQPFVAASHLDESNKAQLVSRLKAFLVWGKHPDQTKVKPEYESKLRDWIAELAPKSFHARLVESVADGSWTHHGGEPQWEQELDKLASELLADMALLNTEIDWLTSAEAQSAFEFGNRVGMFDKSAELIDRIIQGSRGREIGFVRGYIAGLVYGANVEAEVVNLRLDELEKEDPLLSFQIALAGGSRAFSFDRAIRLIAGGKISPRYLRNFTHWVGDVRVTNEQVAAAVRLLLPLATDDLFACDVMVDFLGARFHSGELTALLQSDPDLIWKAITVAIKHPGRETFWLTEVLRASAPTNYPLAMQLACEALVSDNYESARSAENLLANWGPEFPDEVMNGIGALMLDEKVGWRFFASKLGLFHAIPPDVVIRWLQSVGVRGAQRIARHLPKPFLDQSGTATVPKLTEFVLSAFENDGLTFQEFCAGTHSLQLYMGDIASQREAEAASSRPFFNHPVKRIREWARYEYESGIQEAKWHREREDEEGI